MPLAQPLFIGIMSGTSVDGIDVAIVRFADRPELIRFSEFPMSPKLREPVFRLAAPGFGEIDNMGGLDRALGLAFADAALAAIKAAGLKPSDIAAIGNHGQTIRHRPGTRYPFSLQIGCPATIAEATRITTVSDFRSRDMVAGGEGAPLVPFAHSQLFASKQENLAILNIGGIANVTWLGSDGGVTGFDVGPGNMVMDGLMLAISDGRHAYDEDGALAAMGQICLPLLDKLMSHPFLQRSPPKSSGREEFGYGVISQIMQWPDLSDADRMATACQFTADCILDSIGFMPGAPEQWMICGGGACNAHLMGLLKRQLSPALVQTTAAAGIPPRAVEAVSFALLARQTLMGLSNTLPEVTGAAHAVCGGRITPGENWPDLLQAIPEWIR